LTIIDTPSVTQMIRSLIDTYRNLGWLPDCRMSLCKGYTQGGSNADVVLGDAFIKNLTDGIDWTIGYAAVVKDAEVEPFDWSNEGRGGLDSWKSLGYIPVQDFDYKVTEIPIVKSYAGGDLQYAGFWYHDKKYIQNA
jgi:putative alpha-1,2-mannosidase